MTILAIAYDYLRRLRLLTEECTSRENRYNEGVVGGGESSLTVSFDELNEDFGSCDTIDVTGIVTEEDTTEGCESTPE
jgi:hypothetical protein